MPAHERMSDAREEAAVWVARLDRGLDPEDGPALREWLRHPAHRAAIVEIAQQWRGPEVMALLAAVLPRSAAPLSSSAEPPREPLAVSIKAAVSLGIVTICALALMGYSPWSYLHRPQAKRSGSGGTMVFSTRTGEQRTVKLPDDSIATLNTHTRLSVAYSQHERHVTLEYGEASFAVARDPARPFNLHAGARELQATGTRFNVRVLTPQNVEVTVMHGGVKVLYAPPRLPDTPARRREDLTFGEVLLHEAETAVLEPGFQSVRRLVPGEAEARLAWQRGMMVFDGTPLSQVLAEMRRYGPTQFVLTDERLREVRIAGQFRAGDVNALLLTLRKQFIGSRRDGHGRIVLTAFSTL